MSRKRDNDSKRRLEHKLYLAKERPDELFDLSDCGLKEIPSGTFSLVKVLLKTNLLLQNNALKNLESGGNLSDLYHVQVLNLSSNLFQRLPDQFTSLLSLQVLHLSNNHLKSLPPSLMKLPNLHTLNLEDNELKFVPSAIGDLPQLVILKLAGNPPSELPNQLSKLTHLQQLTLSVERMQFPPADVCKEGVWAILRFLGGPSEGNTTSPLVTESHSHVSHPRSSEPTYKPDFPEYISFSGSLEPKMEGHRLRTLELERQLQKDREAQMELALRANRSRQQVLGKLVEEEARMHAELTAVQRRHDEDHNKLISTLLSVEDSASQLIQQLLSRNEATRRQEAAADLDNYKLLVNKPDSSFELRRQEILASMQTMLTATDKAYRDYTAQRQVAQQRALAGDDSDNRGMMGVLTERDEKRKQLANEIAMEEDSQKAAFAQLQMKQDAQAQRLQRDIALVEQELCRLTLAEQERKSKQTEVNQQCLNQHRADLVQLLSQLSKEQQVRQEELKARLGEMEQHRRADQMDYWLIQYQRLLDNKPAELSTKLEPEVEEILKSAGGLDFAPNFQYHRVTYAVLQTMTEEDLQRMGVYATGIRRAILDAVIDRIQASKLKDTKLSSERTPPDIHIPSTPVPSKSLGVEPSAPAPSKFLGVEPSAPTPSESLDVEPSAPSLVLARAEIECCICQDAPCLVVFLQCGHVCTCVTCAGKVTFCPLCRSYVSQRIQLQS